MFHISLPLLRCSLIRPVLPASMTFFRTVEPPGTSYRGLLHLYPDRPSYWAGPDQQKPFKGSSGRLRPSSYCLRKLVTEKFLYHSLVSEMTCLNLPDQSASLLLGPPSWSKVLDQPVTARGYWFQRNSYTSHWSQ